MFDRSSDTGSISFTRNGIVIVPAADDPLAIAKLVDEAYLEEDHGTFISFEDSDMHYEAVLVPFNQSMFGHFVEAVLGDPRHIKPVSLDLKKADFIADLKAWTKEIVNAPVETKLLLCDHPVNDDAEIGGNDILFFLVSSAFYNHWQELPSQAPLKPNIVSPAKDVGSLISFIVTEFMAQEALSFDGASEELAESAQAVDAAMQDLKKHPKEEVLHLLMHNPNRKDRFALYTIAARVLEAEAGSWIRTNCCPVPVNDVDFYYAEIFAVAEAVANCLPPAEGLPVIHEAIKQYDFELGMLMAAEALLHFRHPSTLDWIEKLGKFHPYLGNLAAVSQFNWPTAQRWIAAGGVLSEIAWAALDLIATKDYDKAYERFEMFCLSGYREQHLRDYWRCKPVLQLLQPDSPEAMRQFLLQHLPAGRPLSFDVQQLF